MKMERWLRMAWLATKHRDPAWVFHSDGGWVHRYRGGYIVAEKLSGPPFGILEANTADMFFHGYSPQVGDTVIELGAEYGTETLFLSRAVGATGRVISVEAHPKTYGGLKEAVRRNGLDNVTVVHAAVTDFNGTTTISDGSALSNSVGGGGVEVPAVTLESLMNDNRVAFVDLLKVNIEGSERALISSLGESVASRIRAMVISCHDFRAERGDGDWFRTGRDVDTHLTRLGFEWTRRGDDERPWIQDYRYATRP